jgi:two-component system response regulator RpfG
MGAIIALGHHEKFDGSGYPNGLHGEDIPLVARIVAVADVFDALVSERPYKRAWPVEEAIDHMKNQRGRHFDPRTVDAFLADRTRIQVILDEFGD